MTRLKSSCMVSQQLSETSDRDAQTSTLLSVLETCLRLRSDEPKLGQPMGGRGANAACPPLRALRCLDAASTSPHPEASGLDGLNSQSCDAVTRNR
jgi:hypothetical protein